MIKLSFLVSETYATCTPESAEHGDYEEHGFEFENIEYSFRELYEYIKSEGYTLEGDSLYIYPYTIDYATCTDKTTWLHIKTRDKREERYYNILINMLKARSHGY